MDLREDAIEKAGKQLSEGGYARLSFTRIASELGTTRANLHHHFANKEGLAAAAIEAYSTETLRALRELRESVGEDFSAYVLKAERRILDSASKGSSGSTCPCVQLLIDADSPGGLRPVAAEFLKAKRSILVELARSSQKAGALSDRWTPEAFADTATALLSGLNQMLTTTLEPEALARRLTGTCGRWLAELKPDDR